MQQYKYLIIGGGLAGDAAVRGIRELDPSGSIAMFSMEADPPYTRPNLSKGLWKGKPIERIWRHTEALGVDLKLGRRVSQLSTAEAKVRDENGQEYSYEKLLLATGGTPRHLLFGEGDIIYYRDLEDYRRLRALTESGDRFLVIGGGFIGSEMAAALSMAGKKAVMVMRGPAISANIFPRDLADFVTKYYRDKGVEVITEDEVTAVDWQGKGLSAQTKGGRRLEVDGVVAGIGIQPNVGLAERAGLRVEDGIVVDEFLQTSVPNVFAAGDAANFQHAALGKRTRVEHEDNAIHMGMLAGRNMAGARDKYEHAPMFYSYLFELGYEAVGELSSKLDVISDWQDQFKEGVIYYMQQGRVRGVLLWNVWKQVEAARALIAQPGPIDRAALTIGHKTAPA